MNKTVNWKIELSIQCQKSLDLTAFTLGLLSISSMYINITPKDKLAKFKIDSVCNRSIVISLDSSALTSAERTEKKSFFMFYYALSTILKSASSAIDTNPQKLKDALIEINNECSIMGQSLNTNLLINLTNLISLKNETIKISLIKNAAIFHPLIKSTSTICQYTINGQEAQQARNNLRAITPA